MAISVAPLTTTIMSSVDHNRAGIASGINNAVSRLAGLLGVAVFGVLLIAVFNGSLDRRLGALSVAPEIKNRIHAQRAKLAAVETDDALGRRAIQDSFIDGYRTVLWCAFALALASSVTAALLIRNDARKTL